MRRAEILLHSSDATVQARRESEERIRFRRRQESIRKVATEELAPGGHQEQGESRVTVFRAPDWENIGFRSGERYSDCPFGGRVSADADERHLKDSDESEGFRKNRRHGNELRRNDQ
jgi:hypothetical protein